jgi:DNA-binding NarL/FixJ family response regulator
MKILLADDHALIRAGLRGELETLDTAIEFIEAWDAESLRAMLDRHGDADLAIIDLAMPGMQRERTIAQLRDAYPAIPLVVLSGADPLADAKAVLRAGAAGYIPKSGASKVMLHAIRLVLAGGQYLPPQLVQAVDSSDTPLFEKPMASGQTPPMSTLDQTAPRNRAAPTALDLLSQRQREVFTLLAEGLSNKAIARRLGITEGTVKTHIATIFDVLNVHNRVSAVAAARALRPDGGSRSSSD